MLSEESLEERASTRLAQFPSFLHANGFSVGAGAGMEVLQVAEQVGVLEADALRWSLRALLCARAEEWRRFDKLYDAWFLPANRWQRPEGREQTQGTLSGDQPQGHANERQREQASEEITPRQTASRLQAQRSGDFRELIQREHALEIEAVVRRLARELRHIRMRRLARAQQGRQLDLAATIRRSVASGGTPFHLRWRDRRRVRPRLVLLIDVSRSMMQYSFFYLRLARALSAEMPEVHSYIFHTHITSVTQALNDPDPSRAQDRLALLAQGWAGGTRIGESLAQFNREHAARIVNSRTGILLLSDGYDTGEPRQLADELVRLRRRARRLVWLNPLLGQPGYEPVSAGMQAALPHVDLFAPAGDIVSLKVVLPKLIAALG